MLGAQRGQVSSAPSTGAAMNPTCILLLATLAARVFFSLPLDSCFASLSKHPAHVVLTFHSQALSPKQIIAEHHTITAIAAKYLHRATQSKAVPRHGKHNEYTLTGALEEFVHEVRLACPSDAKGPAVVKGILTGGSTPFSVDFSRVQLNNEAAAIAAHAPRFLSVMTLNLHLLKQKTVWANERPTDFAGNLSIAGPVLDEIAAACGRHRPDVLLLQEAPTPNYKHPDWPAFHRQLLASHPHCACAQASTFLQNCIYSKTPLARSTVHQISSNRSLVSAEITVNGRHIVLISTHVSPRDKSSLEGVLQGYSGTGAILGGDFNKDISVDPQWLGGFSSSHTLLPDHPSYEKTMSTDGTSTADGRLLAGESTDFLLVSDHLLPHVSMSRPLQYGRLISDHCSVLAVFLIFP